MRNVAFSSMGLCRAALLCVVVLVGVLAGCGPATIDGSSEAALKASLEKVRAGVEKGKEGDFDEAVLLLAYADIVPGEPLPSDDGDRVARYQKALNGLTAGEVMIRAAAVKAEKRTRELSKLRDAEAELLKKKAADDVQRAALGKFAVTRAKFMRRETALTREPLIEVSVTNGLDVPVMQATFAATLSSPGRAVPWVKSSFVAEAQGGIVAGETRTLTANPDPFSEWGRVEEEPNMELSATPTRLTGEGGKVLYETTFSEGDAERLAALSSRIAELEAGR